MLFRLLLISLIPLYTAASLVLSEEPTSEQGRYDKQVNYIKSRRFDQLVLTTKFLPNNYLYNVESGAVPKLPAKIITPVEAVVQDPVLDGATTAEPGEVTITATVSAKVEANNILLSTLDAQQILDLRRQAASRLNVALEYQPHSLAPQFALIPAGRFRMGDIQGGGGFDESPVRELQIEQAFGMSTTELSFDLWEQCVQANACSDVAHQQRGGDQGWGKGQRPLINISWLDLQQQFIPWLNNATGEHFRLPTEAEWEYAARAGADTTYNTGAVISRNDANFGKEKCCGGATKEGDKWEFTAPIGSFKPNLFGLYDMHGNVYEWVYDCYSSNYDAIASTECHSAKRVARGGSWYDAPVSLRSANRVKFSENFRIIYLGARLVHVLE